ncbi:MAG: hypothetical protein K2Q10_06865, partial [Rhodospirillales bacterium]|nr:hypothetical protein [Rhodospirillales bacterium]
VSKLTSYTVTVDSANAKVERNFTDLRSKMKEIYTNQALDGMKEQKKTEQAYNATVMNFQSIQNQQELYSNLFRNSYRSPFSGISLDTIA